MLTDTEIRKAKPKDKPYRMPDQGGLYVHVMPSGGKLWRWKYRFHGLQKLMSLGQYPEVTLAEARDLHFAARKLLATGVDPMAKRKTDKIEQQKGLDTSFEAVARKWHKHWSSNKNPDYAKDVMIRLTRDIFPVIGHHQVDRVPTPEIVALVKRIEDRGAREIANRCLGNCSQVFRYAIAHGMATRNPATDIKASDILKPVPVVHMARVGSTEVPRLLRKIENYEGTPVTRLALKIMALVFVRTSELIGGKWSEVDFKSKMWVIPAQRMKKVNGVIRSTPHFVPLARQTVYFLESLRDLTGKGLLMFPHQWNKNETMSKNTILEALYRMGYKSEMTGHGFRGIASTLLHETRARHGFMHEHIELQLAHIKRDDVSAAYDYSAYLPERTAMMQWWADYLDEIRQKPLG